MFLNPESGRLEGLSEYLPEVYAKEKPYDKFSGCIKNISPKVGMKEI